MGYGPIDILRQVPLDLIKLPVSLIERLQVSQTDQTIVLGLIEMAHNLGFKVWAAGVDNEAQLRYLVDNGADYVQGAYFSDKLENNPIAEACLLEKHIADKFEQIEHRNSNC